jgi:hypothetical protein
VSGTVALLDFEMSPRQLDAWLDAQRIHHDDRVHVESLRGNAAAFNLLDEATRKQWADQLRERQVACLIVDCLRPILDALGLDEHHDAGRFLQALDALLREAGVSDCLVVHHMGHGGERSRGDSRLRDWPDVEWRLVRQDEDPASPRFISAYGRDVDISESRLAYDPPTRRLTLNDGSRRDEVIRRSLEDVLGVLDATEKPLSKRSIEIGCEAAGSLHGRDTIRQAITKGVRDGSILTEPGPRNAVLHRSSARVRGSARLESRAVLRECSAAYIEPRTRTLVEEGLSARVVPFDPSTAFGNSEETP